MSPSSQPLPYFDSLADTWVFSRYMDVAAAMRAPGLLPAGATTGTSKKSYGKEHLAMREEALGELTPANLASWQGIIEARAHELLSTFASESAVDLVEDYGRPLCLTAALVVTGAQPDDLDRLGALARIVSSASADPANAIKMKAKNAAAELRRSLPPGPPSLRGPGFIALSQTLLSLMTNIWVALAEHPESFATLNNNPGLLGRSMDELLRYAGVPETLYRVAERDVDFGHAYVKAGQRVVLKLSAAHHDAEVFSNPQRIDLDRRGPAPLCLGLGDHSCVGAGLIRMATTTATGALTQRFNWIRITAPLEWEGGVVFHTPKHLLVMLK